MDDLYAYRWEFEVDPDFETEFVRHYGPAVTWAQLFRQSPDYIETLLLKDNQVPGRYLTLDRWRSEAGVYLYHSLANQTHQLNYYLSDRQQIPRALLSAIFLTTYTSLALFIWSLFVADDHPVVRLDLGIGGISSLLLLVWGFYARNRMNLLNKPSANPPGFMPLGHSC